MLLFISDVLNVARSLTNVREVPAGSNKGPLVSPILASVGLAPGNPWCAAFVYFVVMKVCAALGVANPVPKTGYCPNLARWAKQKKIFFKGSEDWAPQPGDIFLTYSVVQGVYRASHTGFVLSVDTKERTYKTIEGNTNLGGSREGTGVFVRERSYINDDTRFIRLAMVAPSVPQKPKPIAEPRTKLNLSVGPSAKIYLSGKEIGKSGFLDGRNWFPIQTWCHVMGFSLGWDNDKQVALLNKKAAPLTIRKMSQENGLFLPYAPIRELAKFSGLLVDFKKNDKGETIAVYVTRKA